MNQRGILIIDFGGQYTQLIARRVRECGVYSEILPYTAPFEDIRAANPAGVILSGGPASVLDADAPAWLGFGFGFRGHLLVGAGVAAEGVGRHL